MTSKVRDVDLLSSISTVSNGLKPMHTWFSVSQKSHVRVLFDSFFSSEFCGQTMHLTAEVSEGT